MKGNVHSSTSSRDGEDAKMSGIHSISCVVLIVHRSEVDAAERVCMKYRLRWPERGETTYMRAVALTSDTDTVILFLLSDTID
jgi:hypothetical protein